MYQSGANAGSFVAGVADAAADFVCDLYQGAPGALIRSPIGAFNRGMMDSLCGPRNKLPPAPTTPPFTGGQCDCVAYLFDYTVTQPDEPNPIVLSGGTPGKIVGTTTQIRGDNPDVTDMFVIYELCGPGGTTTETASLGSRLTAGTGPVLSNVRREDGLPDNCGNPGPGWDPNLPTEIPESDRSGNTIINNNDGTSVTLPIVLIGSGNIVNIRPEITVDVGGVTVTFDVGGVKIDLGNEGDSPALPPPRNNDSADNFSRIEEILRQIQDELDSQREDIEDLKKDKNDSPPPDEDPEIEAEEDEEESESGDKTVDKLQYVCIHLSKLPNREQWGGGAPDVYYAGWLEFKVKGCNLPRQPIHFKDSIFKAPDGATGFAYTFTNGAKGKATVYKTKESQ